MQEQRDLRKSLRILLITVHFKIKLKVIKFIAIANSHIKAKISLWKQGTSKDWKNIEHDRNGSKWFLKVPITVDHFDDKMQKIQFDKCNTYQRHIIHEWLYQERKSLWEEEHFVKAT